MRMIGERRISQTHIREDADHRTERQRMGRQLIKFNCAKCGKPTYLKVSQAKKYGIADNPVETYVCYPCHTAGKKELQCAMINLARRKGLIK